MPKTSHDYTEIPFQNPELYALAACPVCGFNDHNDDVFNRHACKKGPKSTQHLRLSAERAVIIADLISANQKMPGGLPITPEVVDKALDILDDAKKTEAAT